MTTLQIITLFVALLSTAIWIIGTITSWIGVSVLREGYLDRQWFGRILSLIVSCASITALVYWYVS